MADSTILDLDRFVLENTQYERYHYYKYSSFLDSFPEPNDTSESSFSSGGGWIAIYQENISRVIYIFSPNGEHVLDIPWDRQDPLICIGWIHNDDTLVALDSGGIYRIYSEICKDDHSQTSNNISCHYTQFSLNIPTGCFVLDAQIVPDNDYLIARVNKDNGKILFYGVDLLDIPQDIIIQVPSRSVSDEEIGTILWTGFPLSSSDQPRGFQCIMNHDRIDSSGQSLISAISIESFNTPSEIIIHDKVLDSLEHASITHLAISPNHQYLAIFQRPGLLTILFIQSKPTPLDIVCHAVVIEELEQSKVMDMIWCGNDAIALISSFTLLLVGPHGGTAKISMKSHFYASCDSLSNGLVIWTPNTFEFVRKVPDILVNYPNQISISLILEALDLYSKKDPHSHIILSHLSEKYEKDDNGNMKSILYTTLSSCLDIFQESLSISLQRRILEAWYLGSIYLYQKNSLHEATKNIKNTMKQFHLIEIMKTMGIPINYSAFEYYCNHSLDAFVHRLCKRRLYSVAESVVYICKSQKSSNDSLKYIFMDWFRWHIEILLEPEHNTDTLPSMVIEYLVESIVSQLDRCFPPNIDIWIQMIKLSFELHRVSLSIRLYEKLREKFSSFPRNEIEPLMVYMASIMERMDIAMEYAISTDDLPLAKIIIQCTIERIQYRIHRQSSFGLNNKNSHQHEPYFPVFSCLNQCPPSFKHQFILLYEKSDPELVRSFYYQDDQYIPYVSSLIQEATNSGRELSSNLMLRALEYSKDFEGRISKYMIKVI